MAHSLALGTTTTQITRGFTASTIKSVAPNVCSCEDPKNSAILRTGCWERLDEQKLLLRAHHIFRHIRFRTSRARYDHHRWRLDVTLSCRWTKLPNIRVTPLGTILGMSRLTA